MKNSLSFISNLTYVNDPLTIQIICNENYKEIPYIPSTNPPIKIKLQTIDIAHFLNKPKRALTPRQEEMYKNKLTEFCLTPVHDFHSIHLYRHKGLKIIGIIINRIRYESLNVEYVVHMVWACLSCVHHFLLRLNATKTLMQWIKRREARMAIRVYDRLMQYLVPKFYYIVNIAIITFFFETHIWHFEYFCSNLLHRLFVMFSKYKTGSINQLLNFVEITSITNTKESCQILNVLQQIQANAKWSMMNTATSYRILKMYYYSITDTTHQTMYNYQPLQAKLDASVRAMTVYFKEVELFNTIKWFLQKACLEQINSECVLRFGSLLDHITKQYVSKISDTLLPEDVFPLALQLIASEDMGYSVIGTRVLHNLFDRCNNRETFDTPRLFLKDSQYKPKLHRCNHADKEFFQRYRELLHSTFVAAVIKHGRHRSYLKSIYIAIALFLVEIPCAYTAAACACLAVAIQNGIMENQSVSMAHVHRVHAIVLCIMSLICYIHKAEVFYEYLHKIIEKRACFAPHLNPPFKNNYMYAQHHILWNKPDLFFEDGEVRYGLWKCFRVNKN